jgi:hypothetical protein
VIRSVLRVRFDAVPFDYEHDPAWIFDTGKEFYTVGAGVVGVLQRLAENLDILVAPRRIDGLNGDFVNHDFLLLQPAKT